MIISAESFLKDPNKYLNEAITSKNTVTVHTERGEAVLLSAEEYEKLDVARAVQRGKADIAAGRFITLEAFRQHAENKIAEQKNK
ncbi:MAG: hypothetical protein FWH03_02500 [Firmicutes bacterium]|nr:hypothetical protein [Bacillota bacterium]